MSDYELVDIFNSNVEVLLALFMAFVSATSAFLVVAYLAAKELSSFLLKVAISLYSITSFLLMGIAERQGAVLIGIRNQMGESLSWHPAVYETQWIMPTLFRSVVIVMALLYASSIWYFFHARNVANDTPGKI